MVDFMNHAPGVVTAVFNEDGMFQLIASQDMEAGEHVTSSYGPRSNHDLLMAYGFLIYDSPDDHVPVDFTMSLESVVQRLLQPFLRNADPALFDVRDFTSSPLARQVTDSW